LATNDFTQIGGDGYTMLAKYDKTGEFGALDEALVKYIDQALGGTVGDSYAAAQGRIKVMLTPYTDTVSHWAKTSIKTVYDKNLFKGVTDKSFQPNAPMTSRCSLPCLAGSTERTFPAIRKRSSMT
jgi:hypothetical protein